MAGEDDEIVVTIEGEAAPEPETVVKLEDSTATPAKKAAPENDDIIGTLKAQLAEKETALSAATQRASTAESIAGQAKQQAQRFEQEAAEARTQVSESTRNTIDSGIAAAKAESSAAQEALQTAFEAGNAKAVAEANRRVARAEADLAMLEQAKAELPTQQQRRVETRQQVQQNADPTEDFINSRTAPTANWLRAHRDYLTDPRKNAKMNAAHYEAVGEGLALDSPQYFDFVERKLGLKEAQPEPKPNGGATNQPQTQQTQRRPTAPTAPVTATGGGVNGGATEVRLSKAEADAATDGTLVWERDSPDGKHKRGTPLGIQEFARRKAIMVKQGRYQNISVDGT